MSEDLTEGGNKPWFRKERRATPFAPDKEKFGTQRAVTYSLLAIFALVTADIMYFDDQSLRSTIVQTIINLVLLAVGYWFGASKAGQEQAQSMSRLAEASAPTAAAAVAAATLPQNGKSLHTDAPVLVDTTGDVNIQPKEGAKDEPKP